jgi:DNA processing protein
MGRQLLDAAQRRDWLRLICSENVGPITFRQLINRYGSASGALDALPELARRGGLQRPIRIGSADQAERDLERIAALGARLTAYGEEGYPPLLREIDSAPPLLCLKGDLSLLSLPAVAIVGARNASALGRKFARQLAAELAHDGFLIVSGLARGIRLPMRRRSNRAPQRWWPVASTLSTRRKMENCTARLANEACSLPNACRARSRRQSIFRAATG